MTRHFRVQCHDRLYILANQTYSNDIWLHFYQQAPVSHYKNELAIIYGLSFPFYVKRIDGIQGNLLGPGIAPLVPLIQAIPRGPRQSQGP